MRAFLRATRIMLSSSLILGGVSLVSACGSNDPTESSTSEFAREIPRIPPRLPLPDLRPNCPDPATVAINYSIIRKTTPFDGWVKIDGVLRNIGKKNYVSNPNQQLLHLYEDNRLVATQAWQNLTPGQDVTVSFQRFWRSSSPAEGEFPPTYKIVVVYDPDIYLDANLQNDDCRVNDNQLSRSGSGINELF